jgi:hypothetical protein
MRDEDLARIHHVAYSYRLFSVMYMHTQKRLFFRGLIRKVNQDF